MRSVTVKTPSVFLDIDYYSVRTLRKHECLKNQFEIFQENSDALKSEKDTDQLLQAMLLLVIKLPAPKQVTEL